MTYHEAMSQPVRPNPVVEAYKKDIDRTLLLENLKLSTAERAEKMISALRFAEAVRNSRVKVEIK